MGEASELAWQSLISCIQETSTQKDCVYALLVSRPVPDESSRHKDICSCADGRVKERAPCPLDDLILYVRAGEHGKVNQSYLGFAERVLDPDSAKVSYTNDAFRQLKHEAGVRLLKLSETGRDVYFTSSLLGYKLEKVNEELLDKLLGSDKRSELGFVRVDILKKLGISVE